MGVLSSFSLRFAEGRSGWVFVAALAAAVGLVYWFYRAHVRGAAATAAAAERRLDRRRALALLALRAGVVAILVLFLFRPAVSFERRTAPRSTLAVAVDRSRSMAARDFEGLDDRLGRATGALVSSGSGGLESIAEDFETRLFAFDAAARQVSDAEALLEETAGGDETDLVAAVRGAVGACRTAGAVDVAGVVLLTDGLHTGEADPARTLGGLGVPVYAVGVGSSRSAGGGLRDVRIAAVRAPSATPVNGSAKVRVLVEACGYAGRIVPVRILAGAPGGAGPEEELARAEVTLDDEVGEQEVVLRVACKETGQHECRAVVAADAAENIRWNNERGFFLNVTDPRVMVLYLEGAVRAEFKHLRRLFERDPQVEVIALIKVRTGVFRRLGATGEVALDDFPRSRQEIEPFDVFVIGDLDATHFTHGQLEDIAREVRESGKGLLLLQGVASFGAGGYGGTALAGIAPLAIGGRDEAVETVEFRMKLTPEGASHPVFEGLAGTLAAGSLPPFQAMNAVGRSASPDAVVLAVRDDTGAVVVAAGRAGSGRVLAVTAGPTWPWVFAAGEGPADPASAHSRFWAQAVRFLAGQEDQAGGPGVTLRLDRGEALYAPGEPVTLRARVRGPKGEPVPAAEVNASVRAAGRPGEPLAVRLSPTPGQPGEFEATFTPSLTGPHEVAARAGSGGETLGEAKVKFEVERPSREDERYDLDERALVALAEATGGAYAPIEGLDGLVSSLRARQSVKREPVGVDFGSRPSLVTFFFTLVALTGAEWYMRRRMQMA